ncbi:esterase/lipase family protein, partial [Massilia horti]
MSVRRIVRWLLLAEAVLAAAIGLLLWRWLGLAPALAAAGGLLCVLLVRLAINANNFLMSAHGASATPAAFRLGPGGWLRLLLGEFKASMLLSSWYMPRAAAHTRVYSDARTPPVLLLHGYGCNSGYWFHLVQLFDAAHISHASLDLEPLGGDIDGYAPLVEQAAARLCAAAHARQLVIVAHSMGGLVARAWMRKYGSARVARVVTLG